MNNWTLSNTHELIMFESKLACMKENQLVWKRMTLYERKWASVKVTVNPLLSTRLAKPHPANARQTTWTQRHPGILHHSSLQLHRACPGQGVWSGHFGRDHFQLHKEVEELFLYSNSDYYLPQKYLESEVLQRRRKEGARFSATRSPIRYFFWYSPPSTQIFWVSARAALAEAS